MGWQTGITHLRGAALVAAITSVCASGMLLFGYDQGVMSGVVISTFWLEQMGNPSTIMVSTITALYDVGAFFGAIFAAFTAEALGRRRTLTLGASIVAIGSILMGSSFERVQFMVARIVTGIGIGYCTAVASVYQSEIARAAQRGWQVCCQCTLMLFGIMVAYWINYGLYFHESGLQWRFPLLFQLIFAIYIICLTPFLPDTPRWLMRHDETAERGRLVLSKLRDKPMDDPTVQAESHSILEAIRIEAQEEGSWLDLFQSNGIQAHKRFYLALGIQFMQQLTGINIVTYYAPTLFKTSLGFSSQLALLMGCFLQVWYILASLVTWYTIDRFGRRPLFIVFGLAMCVVLVLEAVCVGIGGPSASIAAVVFVFLFEACFTWGWMGTVWVYPPEILPLKIRAKGAALAAAADFLGNFLVVEITPPALKNIGWKTYVIFAVLNIVNVAVVWMFYPETSGIPLEAIDLLFTDQKILDAADEDKAPRWMKLQWSIVRKAADEVKQHKQLRKAGSCSGVPADSVDEETASGKSGSDVEHLDLTK